MAAAFTATDALATMTGSVLGLESRKSNHCLV
jgi:hypothetical protein